jgi:hypothetical protein
MSAFSNDRSISRAPAQIFSAERVIEGEIVVIPDSFSAKLFTAIFRALFVRKFVFSMRCNPVLKTEQKQRSDQCSPANANHTRSMSINSLRSVSEAEIARCSCYLARGFF